MQFSSRPWRRFQFIRSCEIYAEGALGIHRRQFREFRERQEDPHDRWRRLLAQVDSDDADCSKLDAIPVDLRALFSGLLEEVRPRRNFLGGLRTALGIFSSDGDPLDGHGRFTPSECSERVDPMNPYVALDFLTSGLPESIRQSLEDLSRQRLTVEGEATRVLTLLREAERWPETVDESRRMRLLEMVQAYNAQIEQIDRATEGLQRLSRRIAPLGSYIVDDPHYSLLEIYDGRSALQDRQVAALSDQVSAVFGEATECFGRLASIPGDEAVGTGIPRQEG